jgi:hypothetical protein
MQGYVAREGLGITLSINHTVEIIPIMKKSKRGGKWCESIQSLVLPSFPFKLETSNFFIIQISKSNYFLICPAPCALRPVTFTCLPVWQPCVQQLLLSLHPYIQKALFYPLEDSDLYLSIQQMPYQNPQELHLQTSRYHI